MLTTLANVRLKLGLPDSDTSQDALLSVLIGQASKFIETWCNRIFERTTWTEFPRTYGTRHLRLKQKPVLSITSVYIDSTRTFAASSLLTPGDDYQLVNGRLLRPGGWPAAIEYRRGLLAAGQVPADGVTRVTYVAGYDDPNDEPPDPPDVASPMPADLILAADMLVAKLAGMAATGEDYNSERLEDYAYVTGTPTGAGLDWLIGEIQPILQPYRRSRL